jgi:hypothetical protein
LGTSNFISIQEFEIYSVLLLQIYNLDVKIPSRIVLNFISRFSFALALFQNYLRLEERRVACFPLLFVARKFNYEGVKREAHKWNYLLLGRVRVCVASIARGRARICVLCVRQGV